MSNCPNLSPEQLSLAINAAALAIAQGRSVDELALISSIFVAIGDLLVLIATQKECLETQYAEKTDTDEEN